ncbi:hypothetical protein J1779_07770 [Rahnella sp. FC061912-K]|uniref:hypothetical protein n=1 Tax=Rahnella rivi TaxID=2816249 RepID=UPI001C26606C|nr:hypothetical protein [Rahnella rivi]MBU9829827.1 hypothetical protein [Rahnella rivi]
MKYEITKGSEKDFDGIGNEDVVRVYDTGQTKFYAVAEEIRAIPSDWFIIAERQPISEPVWDGEGLPPVGCECEFTSYAAGDVWHAGVVRYLSEHTIVIEFTDMLNGKAESISHPRTMKFRPLRSPEDVARDEFGAAVAGVRMSELYDAIAAGKIPGVKLE